MSGMLLTRVVQAVGAVRTGFQGLTRRMVPPEVGLLELVSGFMTTQAVYAAARLGIADVLAAGPLAAYEIAARVGAQPDAMARLLRACATFGVFVQHRDGRYGLTPLADALRAGTDGSMLPVVLLLGHPLYQGPWGRLAHTVQSGEPGAESIYGKPLWDFFRDEPEFATTFHTAMARLSALDWPAVRAAYDFTRFSTIADLGGGTGEFLALVLQAAPAAQGILLEQPELTGPARENLRRARVGQRCRVETGSFFETVPAGADLVVMRRVIHDFDDDRAVAILSNVRRRLSPGATLLLVESVVPGGNTPHFAKMLDLDMMIFVGGRERTEVEFAELLERAGLEMSRVIPTMSTLSLVEAAAGGRS